MTIYVLHSETPTGSFKMEKTSMSLLATKPLPAKNYQIEIKPIFATNMLSTTIDDKGIKGYLDTWKEEYDFHTINIVCNLNNEDNARGIKKFEFHYKITDGTKNTDKTKLFILDVLPNTKWVSKNYKAEINAKIEASTGGLKFSLEEPTQKKKETKSEKTNQGSTLNLDPLTGTLGGAETSLSFTYQWNPKVAEIISNLNSFKASATDFTYLDGEIGLTLLIQRERNIKEMFLEGNIQATMDIAFKQDIIRKKPITEKIFFKPSKI